jgi:hypothetical protein
MLASVLSFIAILALAALNGWLGRSGRLGRDPGDPRVRIALDLIDFDEREGQAANDGRAHVALGTSDHDLAVAIRLGDGWVTRRLGPASLRSVNRAGPRLTLSTHDFTLPVIDLAFADGEQAVRWETRLADLIRDPTRAPREAIVTELAGAPHP